MTILARAGHVEQPTFNRSLVAAHGGAEDRRSIYLALTGIDPAEADIDTDHDFDRHVLASIIAAAALEDGPLARRVGLAASDLIQLISRWFPTVAADATDDRAAADPEDDEVTIVRELLLAHRSTDGEDGRWLARMVARRAVEPSHLWEDLGLRNRGELSRLIERHFAPLALRNTRNMRWKRFFYRMLCEDDGFLMCATPVCTDCCDFENCFGEEGGESRLARRRRDSALGVPAV
jgi:nitrogen fixation protein NifQ